MNPFVASGKLSFAVFFCPLEKASNLVAKIYQSPDYIRVKPIWSIKEKEAPKFLNKSNGAPLEIVLWQPVETSSTIFQSNNKESSFHAIKSLSKNCRIMYLSVRDGFEDSYPNAVVGLYENGIRIRYVQSIYAENGWEFFAFGDVQQFENLLYYKKRKIKDRLNRNILVEYMLKNGLDVRSDDFWRTNIEPHYYVHGWLARERSLLPYAPKTEGQT